MMRAPLGPFNPASAPNSIFLAPIEPDKRDDATIFAPLSPPFQAFLSLPRNKAAKPRPSLYHAPIRRSQCSLY
jgi:hypothetical protein